MFRVILAVHILAAVVFVGNVITAAFWKVRADRSGNLESIASTCRAVLLADYVFTLPGIVALVVTGVLMVGMTGWARFQEPWLAVSLALVVLVGVLWVGVLLPLQLRMVRGPGERRPGPRLRPGQPPLGNLWGRRHAPAPGGPVPHGSQARELALPSVSDSDAAPLRRA